MNRMTRIAVALVATVAATVGPLALPASAQVGNTVYINGVPYVDKGIVSLGEDPDVNGLIDSALSTLAGSVGNVSGSCIPKHFPPTIYQWTAHVYYGALDSVYVWQDPATVEAQGCPNNTVSISVRIVDQGPDGNGTTTGDPANSSSQGSADAVGSLVLDYSNVTLALGLSYHQLTTTVSATETDGKTTLAACATRSWTYRATLRGPEPVTSTPQQATKCGA